MRIGVLKTLSVRNAVKQQDTSKIDVETNYTVSIVVKNTVLTLKNAEFGTKKRKSYVLSSPEICLSLKRGNLLRPLLQYLESVMPTLPSLLCKRFLWLMLPLKPIRSLFSTLSSSTIKYNKHKQQNRRTAETKGQTNTTNKSQTKTPTEEKKVEVGL